MEDRFCGLLLLVTIALSVTAESAEAQLKRLPPVSSLNDAPFRVAAMPEVDWSSAPVGTAPYHLAKANPDGTVQPAEPVQVDIVPETYDSCCSPPCCAKKCCCCCWSAVVDVIALKRSDPGSYTFIVNENAPQTRVFDPQQLDFDYELGPRVRIRRQSSNGRSWEAGYFGIYSWEAQETVTGLVRLLGPGFQLGFAGPAAGSFDVNYDSSLQSAELNFRPARSNQWGWFVGARYIRLDEAFVVHETTVPISNLLRVDTLNNLWGGQLGAEFNMFGFGMRQLRVQGRLSTGLYFNDAVQQTRSSILAPVVGASSDDLAFVGSGEVSLVYQLTNRLSIRGGYQVMGISGVALASDQVNSSAINVAEATVNLSGLWLTGAHTGMELRW